MYNGELERYHSSALMPASTPSGLSATLMRHISRELLDGKDWHRCGISHHCLVLVAPLSDSPAETLSERDMRAMTLLFEVDGIDDFEADIDQMLLSLVPEPCWEADLLGHTCR